MSKKCKTCKTKDAAWARCKESGGKDYYCNKCALLEFDFGVPRILNVDGRFWEKINKETLQCVLHL